jgi:hypothetical protein
MARRSYEDDDEYDDYEGDDEYDDYEDAHDAADPEGTDPRDIARFDRDTIACPDCGREIYADASHCPYCRTLLTRDEYTGSHRKPMWFVITAIVCLVIALLWVLFDFHPWGRW